MQNAQQQQGQEVVNREGIQLSTLSTPQTTNTISVSANEYPDLITQVRRAVASHNTLHSNSTQRSLLTLLQYPQITV